MRRQPRSFRDRGAETVEWGAALLMLATVMAVLVGPTLPQSVQDGIGSAICRVFHFGDPGQCQPRQFKPDKCIVQSTSQGYGATLDVAFVRLGKDLGFTQIRDSNGRVTVVAGNGTTLGAVKGVGHDFQWGVVKGRVGAEASASLRAGEGDSWVFENQAAADQFMEDIQKEGVRDAVDDLGPIGWVGRQIVDVVDPLDLPPPTTTRTEIELKAGVGAGAGLSLGFTPKPEDQRQNNPDTPPAGDTEQPGDTEQAQAVSPDSRRDPLDYLPDKIKPKADASVGLEIGGKAIVERNHKDGTTTVTETVSGSGRAGASYVLGKSGGKSVSGEVQGTVQLTYNDKGELAGLALTRAVTTNGTSTTTTTTEVPITSAAERKAVSEQLGGTPIATHVNLTWDDFAPASAPEAGASAFRQLLYDKGRTSRTTYSYTPGDRNYGGRLALGAQLGANLNISSRELKVQKAEYLAAPGAGGQREWKNFEECHA